MALATPSYGPRLPKAQGYKGAQNPQQLLPMGGAPENAVQAPGLQAPPMAKPPSMGGAQAPSGDRAGAGGDIATGGLARPPAVPGSLRPQTAAPIMPDGRIQPQLVMEQPGYQAPPTQGQDYKGPQQAAPPPAPPQPPSLPPPPGGSEGWSWNGHEWTRTLTTTGGGGLPTGQPTGETSINRTPDGVPITGYQAPGINLPDQSAPQDQLINQLRQMISSGGSLNDDWTAKMRAREQADATQMGQQASHQIQGQAVANGRIGSGQTGAQSRQVQQGIVNAMLGGFRDTDIQRATTNWQDEMGATSGLEGALGGQFQRAAAGQQMGQDRYFGEQDLAMRARQLAIQKALGEAGIGVDRSRIGEQGREFDMGNTLNWASLLNNMVMGRAGLGLDYANLNMNNMSGLLGWLGGLGENR